MSTSYPPHLHPQQQSSSEDAPHPPNQLPGKRKRLLKACEACHKSKRRCDGQCPCQNCDFAGKQCVYKDSTGRMVPPPYPRVPQSTSLSSAHPPVPKNAVNSTQQSSTYIVSSRPNPLGSGLVLPSIQTWSPDNSAPSPQPIQDLSTMLHDVGLDPHLCRELVNLFFSHCHPQNTMFHRPTFLNALATAQIPKYLLISVFALAAPFSLHPSLRKPSTSGAGSIPHWQTGDRFAQRAVAELRSYGPPDACGRISAANRPGEELEFSQTLCILALHECAMRRPGHIHLKYMSLALKTLVELGVPEWDVSDEIPPTSEATALAPGHSANMAHPDANGMWRRRECHRRTLWVIHWTNMLASAFSLTSIRFRELDVRLYLPMDEGAFDMVMKDDVVPEFLTLKSDGPRARTYISEFGHLLRVTLIYSQIMSIFSERSEASRRRSGNNGEMHQPFDAFQTWDAALERWRASLPDRLQLTVDNIDMHMASFEFGGGGSGPWAFMYMHALAQCSLLVLYAVFELESNHEAIQKYGRMRENAHNILLSLMNRLGPRGRSSIWLAALLLHVGGHGPPVNEDALRRYAMDSLTTNLLKEYEGNWGVHPSELFSLEFRAHWIHDGLDASQFHPSSSVMSTSRGVSSDTEDNGRQSSQHHQQLTSNCPNPCLTAISSSSCMPLPLQRQMLSGPSDMDEDNPDVPHAQYTRFRDELTLPPLRNVHKFADSITGGGYSYPHQVQDPRYLENDSAPSSVEPRRRGPIGMPWLAEEAPNNVNVRPHGGR